METLVLNLSYLPISRVPWQKAITWVVTDRAEIVEEYEDNPIRSAYKVFPMPSVIRLLHQVQGLFRKGVKFNRKNVWLRDKNRCQYCGIRVSLSEFTFDHILPQSRGGKTKWENIVVSCYGCNQKKGHRTPREAGMHLRTSPVKPRSLPGMVFPALTWGEHMPESWRSFLFSVGYWNGKLEP